jgi:hypothetical protein
MIVNDASRVIRMTIQNAVSPTIVILMTLKVSFRLLENIYNTGITHDNRHMAIKIFYSIGHWGVSTINLFTVVT